MIYYDIYENNINDIDIDDIEDNNDDDKHDGGIKVEILAILCYNMMYCDALRCIMIFMTIILMILIILIIIIMNMISVSKLKFWLYYTIITACFSVSFIGR